MQSHVTIKRNHALSHEKLGPSPDMKQDDKVSSFLFMYAVMSDRAGRVKNRDMEAV